MGLFICLSEFVSMCMDVSILVRVSLCVSVCLWACESGDFCELMCRCVRGVYLSIPMCVSKMCELHGKCEHMHLSEYEYDAVCKCAVCGEMWVCNCEHMSVCECVWEQVWGNACVSMFSWVSERVTVHLCKLVNVWVHFREYMRIRLWVWVYLCVKVWALWWLEKICVQVTASKCCCLWACSCARISETECTVVSMYECLLCEWICKHVHRLVDMWGFCVSECGYDHIWVCLCTWVNLWVCSWVSEYAPMLENFWLCASMWAFLISQWICECVHVKNMLWMWVNSDHTCICEHVHVCVQMIICKDVYVGEGICNRVCVCDWVFVHVRVWTS